MTGSHRAPRSELRATRRALGADAQVAGADAVARRLWPWLRSSGPGIVAAYLATTDGELSPGPCVKLLRGAGATLVFPRIADDAMTFHIVGHDDDLIPGEWDLLEPASTAGLVDAAAIDVVLAPLVAFDDRCERMGRGKAYYDRCFAFLAEVDRPAQPVLIGLAHDCQRVEALDCQPHDVRLDAVVTPSSIVGTLPS